MENVLIQLLLAVAIIMIVSKAFRSTALFRKLCLTLAISVILGAAIKSNFSDSKGKDGNNIVVTSNDDALDHTPVLFDLVTNPIELQGSYETKVTIIVEASNGKELQSQQQSTTSTSDRASPLPENSS